MVPPIAYVLTRYPSPSHTFIQRELARLGDHGIDTVPFVINAAAEAEILSPADEAERARSIYLKGTNPLAILLLVGRTLVRTPLRALGGLRLARRLAGTDLRLFVTACGQLVEAMMIATHCRRKGIRHLHAHFGQAPASIAMLTAHLLKGSTWSVTIHGWHEFVTEDSSALRLKASHATALVAISDFTRSQLMRIADPDDWRKISVVRCGIPLDEFQRRPAKPLPGGAIRILIVARLSAEKGHAVLIDACRQLVDEGTELSLDIIGTGPSDEHIRQRVRDNGLDDLVTMHGALPPSSVAAMLRDADVFCLPTFAEGLPVSLMEAMAIGVPVVTTPISGIPELVVDGVSGHTVPAGRVDELAAKLLDAVRGSEKSTILDRARKLVEQHHDVARSAQHLAEVFVDIGAAAPTEA